MKTENLPTELAAKLEEERLKFERAVEAADEAFWAEIVRHYPEVQSGDLSPSDTFLWNNVSRRTVAAWVENNMPKALA